MAEPEGRSCLGAAGLRSAALKVTRATLQHLFQVDIEQLDPRGRTPLHLATTLGHLECARVLLAHGADVGRENRSGWTGGYPCSPHCTARVSPASGTHLRLANRSCSVTLPLLPVLQEAVSTRDLELVQLVLRYRDYQRVVKRLAGIPVLLEKLRKVRPSLSAPYQSPCIPFLVPAYPLSFSFSRPRTSTWR